MPLIRGLKHRADLCLISHDGMGGAGLVHFLNKLSLQCINLVFFCYQGGAGVPGDSCLCLEEKDLPCALELASQSAASQNLPLPEKISRVALITLYPRDPGIRLLSAVQSLWGEAGIIPLHLGSSLSAVAAVVERDHYQRAVEVLAKSLGLPEEASPPDKWVKVIQSREDRGDRGRAAGPVQACGMETVAVYAEHPVRTYGLAAQDGLSLLRAVCPAPGVNSAAGILAGIQSMPKVSLGAAKHGQNGWQLLACTPGEQRPEMAELLEGSGFEVQGEGGGLSLIHLQGPHFGDRWGIAALALDACQRAGAEPLCAAGVMHSLMLAVEPGSAGRVLKELACDFCGPERKDGARTK